MEDARDRELDSDGGDVMAGVSVLQDCESQSSSTVS